LSLLKHCYGLQDYEGRKSELYYLRTKEKKKIDFCLVEDDKPVQMIEVKNGKSTLSKVILQFNQKYNIPGIMLMRNLRNEKTEKTIEFRKATSFLSELYM
jgi:hypothetical protein